MVAHNRPGLHLLKCVPSEEQARHTRGRTLPGSPIQTLGEAAKIMCIGNFEDIAAESEFLARLGQNANSRESELTVRNKGQRDPRPFIPSRVPDSFVLFLPVLGSKFPGALKLWDPPIENRVCAQSLLLSLSWSLFECAARAAGSPLHVVVVETTTKLNMELVNANGANSTPVVRTRLSREISNVRMSAERLLMLLGEDDLNISKEEASLGLRDLGCASGIQAKPSLLEPARCSLGRVSDVLQVQGQIFAAGFWSPRRLGGLKSGPSSVAVKTMPDIVCCFPQVVFTAVRRWVNAQVDLPPQLSYV